MSARSKNKGHDIIFKEGKWYYEKTNELVSKTHWTIPCGFCGKKSTDEGHDGCLGTLIGIMNACCGHGIPSEAYVQFWDGEGIYGEDALTILNILKKYKINKSQEAIAERKKFLMNNASDY